MLHKRRIAGILVLCLILQLMLTPLGEFGISTAEASDITGTCTANSLYVRKGPGTSYAIMTAGGSQVILHKGDTVKVKSTSGNWYQVNVTYKGTSVTGYCYKTYIKTSSTKVTSTPTPKLTTAATSGYSIKSTITANVLNMRSGAGTSYSKVTSLTKGATVYVTGTAKDAAGSLWYKVSTTISSKSYSGYMLATYIKLSSSIPAKVTNTPTPTKAVATQKSGYVNANQLNIRSGAGTTYTKYGTLVKNTALVILSEKKDSAGALWYQVSCTSNGGTLKGYVLAKYVTVNKTTSTPTNTPKPTATSTPKPTATSTPKPTATSTPKPTATNTPTPTKLPEPTKAPSYSISATVNASSLNMRSGAGTEYTKIINLGRNQALTVTGYALDSDGERWYLCSAVVSGVTYEGYMLGTYIVLSEEIPEQTTEIVIPDKLVNPPYYIEAVMTGSSVNMRTGPSTAFSIITKLNELQKVYVYGQSLNGSIYWYQIATEIDGELLLGYVSSTYVKLMTTTEGVWAKTNSEVSLYQTPATSSTAIPLATDTFVYITEEQMVSGVKWMRIATQKDDSIVYRYVQAMYLAFCESTVEAPFDPYIEDEDFEAEMASLGFPDSYLPYLIKLHQEHPNWNFRAFQTGLDWSTVISNENQVGLNLIPNSKAIKWLSFDKGAYKWNTDTFVPYDGSTWVTVSKAGLSYYMDPRNFLLERYIFMFEELTFDSVNQTQDGVENILKGTPMYKKTFSYTDASGNTKTILYSKAFMEAAKYSGVSAYHLASRVKQEVVVSSTAFSNSVTGTVSGFEGYYNFYNIGAYNSTASLGAIKNGLKFAKYGGSTASLNTASMIPWNNRYSAIVGGGYYIGYSYINRGQNSIYLQKFNVTGRSTYAHQYMANVEAPKSEAYKVYLAYSAMEDYADMNITFSIPVYNDMPTSAVQEPAVVYNPNNYLEAITLKDQEGNVISLNEKFVYDTTSYTATAESSVTSVATTASCVASSAKVSGTGTTKLTSGSNKVVLTVEAANGTTRTYTITIKK